MAEHDLKAIKANRSVESKDAVTESGIWFNTRLQEFQGYVVLSEKVKYLVTSVTEKFLANDPDPNGLMDQLSKHVDEFKKRKKVA